MLLIATLVDGGREKKNHWKDAYCEIVARSGNEIKCEVEHFPNKGVQMLIVNDELIPSIAYLYEVDQSGNENSETSLGGKVMAARQGRCHLGEPVVRAVSPATISTQATGSKLYVSI